MLFKKTYSVVSTHEAIMRVMRRRLLYYYLCVLYILFFTEGRVFTQGIHYSQIDHIPLFLNPALTSSNPLADYHIGINYRQQETFANTSYTTYNAYADLTLKPSFLNDSWMGAGVLVSKDKVSDVFDNTLFILNLAYHQSLFQEDILSFGASFQYEQDKLSTNNLLFEDQWTGVGYDPSIPSQNQLTSAFQTYKLGVGLQYFKNINEDFNLYIGAACLNINRPVYHSIKEAQNSKNDLGNSLLNYTIPFRYHLHAGFNKRLGDMVVNKTYLYYALQASNQEMVMGTYFKFDTYLHSTSSILAGLAYRLNSALIFLGGVELGKLKFMITYDANIYRTDYQTFYTNNAIEVSALIQMNYAFYERGSHLRNKRIQCRF